MCGRYTLKTPAKAVANLFGLAGLPDLVPRYNLAPTQQVLCVREEQGASRAALLRWGLVPSWAKEPSIGNKLINARAETVAQKPAFRTALKRRRCLLVADGFYEWQKLDGGGKQPWYFHLKEDEPFGFAGLWETWHAPDGSDVETCTLITTTANDLVAPMHDRMPVILPAEHHGLWLDPGFEGTAQLQSLLAPYAAEEMAAHPVSPRVNSPRNEGPELVAPSSSQHG